MSDNLQQAIIAAVVFDGVVPVVATPSKRKASGRFDRHAARRGLYASLPMVLERNALTGLSRVYTAGSIKPVIRRKGG